MRPRDVAKLVGHREFAVVLALHDPAAAATDRLPHVHVMAPARKLGRRFGSFTDPVLCSDRGATIIADEWRAWKKERPI